MGLCTFSVWHLLQQRALPRQSDGLCQGSPCLISEGLLPQVPSDLNERLAVLATTTQESIENPHANALFRTHPRTVRKPATNGYEGQVTDTKFQFSELHSPSQHGTWNRALELRCCSST